MVKSSRRKKRAQGFAKPKAPRFIKVEHLTYEEVVRTLNIASELDNLSMTNLMLRLAGHEVVSESKRGGEPTYRLASEAEVAEIRRERNAKNSHKPFSGTRGEPERPLTPR